MQSENIIMALIFDKYSENDWKSSEAMLLPNHYTKKPRLTA